MHVVHLYQYLIIKYSHCLYAKYKWYITCVNYIRKEISAAIFNELPHEFLFISFYCAYSLHKQK